MIEATIQNDDETFIVSDQGSVVMVSQAYWEEIQETLRLLDDQQSLLALLQGQQARKAGRPMATKTIADVFYDLVRFASPWGTKLIFYPKQRKTWLG